MNNKAELLERDYFPLILNNSNLVTTQYNNTYRYSFPSGVANFPKGTKMAVASVSIFYSWRNITASLNNNEFQFIMPDSGGTTTYTVTIPDGYYSISDINNYLQGFCVTNSLYLVDASGNNVYFIEVEENSTYYSVQWNLYLVETSLPVGWTDPASFSFPAVAATTQVIINANDFADVVGLPAGTFPTVADTATTSQLSTYTPQVTPVQSVVLTCDLVKNIYANPTSVLYSFGAGGVGYGNLISSAPNELTFVEISAGTFSNFSIQFLDQSFNNLLIQDTNLIVQLFLSLPPQ